MIDLDYFNALQRYLLISFSNYLTVCNYQQANNRYFIPFLHFPPK